MNPVLFHIIHKYRSIYIDNNVHTLSLSHRLHRFDYFNIPLRPLAVKRCRRRLLDQLDLDNFLSRLVSPKTSNSATAIASDELYNRDISLGIVGESHAGKSTLVEALRGDKGVSSAPDNVARERSRFEVSISATCRTRM